MTLQTLPTRLLSLDVTRGLIMLLLAAEACGLYEALHHAFPTGWASALIGQFFHHEWNGLYFWDLVQPSFMLIAGSSLYISWTRKRDHGISWGRNFRDVGWRAAKLFFLGAALHCVYAGKLVWELWNVLTQLAFTTVIAYLIIRWSFAKQLAFSIGLLALTELLYRSILVPGYDQPFVKGENFGAYFDILVMGNHNSGGWAFINFIPTAAHTVWGVLVGKLLVDARPNGEKLRVLLGVGVGALVIGYGMDWMGMTPIIKRISTSSFVLASGGYVLLILAALVWLLDIRRRTRFAWVFVVIGMNPIFIYLFFESVGKQWLNGTVDIFVGGAARSAAVPADLTAVIVALATLAFEWYLCYWLYQRKIFFKL